MAILNCMPSDNTGSSEAADSSASSAPNTAPESKTVFGNLRFSLCLAVLLLPLLVHPCSAACPAWGTGQPKESPSNDDFGISPRVIPIPVGTLYLPEKLETQGLRMPGDAEGAPPRRPRRVVINYARGCCTHAQWRNCVSALKFGADFCIAYNESVLSAVFKKRNDGILRQNRGGGYWLWKPYLILQTLTRLDDGDMVLYSDAAQDFVDDTRPLFEQALGNQPFVVGKAQWYHNLGWVKMDTFLLMGCLHQYDNATCFDSYQLQASTFVFRKSEASFALVAKWLAYAQDERAITDLGNTLGHNDPHNQTWHRHDQSIVSLIVAMQGDQTVLAYSDEYKDLEFDCTVKHHRIRD